ncbi:MAG: methylthioribulose 1-phosphate dehydratase [Chromatiales bacterium]|nr:methylthioribulose 1-phosphate dehydratase [Chromatiales bacterium]
MHKTMERLTTELIDAGRFFASRGWVPATSGNFSARVDETRMAITVSGRHKGELRPEDIMLADLDGNSLEPGKRSSAETGLHSQLYRRDPAVGAVLHVHSVNATVLSRLHRDHLELRDYEVLKAFPSVTTHSTSVRVPIFENDQDIARLAAKVEAYMQANEPMPGYLIEGHGFYTWGATLTDARRHVEAFEFLFECEVLSRRLGL